MRSKRPRWYVVTLHIWLWVIYIFAPLEMWFDQHQHGLALLGWALTTLVMIYTYWPRKDLRSQ